MYLAAARSVPVAAKTAVCQVVTRDSRSEMTLLPTTLAPYVRLLWTQLAQNLGVKNSQILK